MTFDFIIYFYIVTWLLLSEVFAAHKFSGAAPFSLSYTLRGRGASLGLQFYMVCFCLGGINQSKQAR